MKLRVLRRLTELALTIPEMWAKMIQHDSALPAIPILGARLLCFNRGPVAQLGARFHGMEEVVGSIPTRSTKSLNGLAPIAILIPKFFRRADWSFQWQRQFCGPRSPKPYNDHRAIMRGYIQWLHFACRKLFP